VTGWGRARRVCWAGNAVRVPVVVESDSAVLERLSAVLAWDVVVLADVASLYRYLGVDVGESVVVLGPSVDLVSATELAGWARVARPNLIVILVRREGAAAVSGEASRAGIRDVVNERDHAGLVVAVRRAAAVAGVIPRRKVRGGVVTVFAALRGVGATTLAINLAAVLGQGGGRGACLVDLALRSSEFAEALRLSRKRSMGDVLPIAGGSLDVAAVTGLVTPYAPGLGVLLPPGEPDTAGAIPAGLSGTVLHLLRQAYDWVVIHTPVMLDDHVLGALDLTDVLVLPTTLNVPALTSLNRTLDTLAVLNFPRERWRVVLNQAGTGTEVTPGEAQKVLRVPFSAQIPHSPDVAASAARGVPLFLADPDHEVSRAIRRFAEGCRAGQKQWRRESGPAPRRSGGMPGGFRRAVYQTVMDELGPAALDQLCDAFVEVDRAIHTALAAVLAHGQATLDSADAAAITRDVMDAILRYGSAPASHLSTPSHQTAQHNPERPSDEPLETLGARLRAHAEAAASTWGLRRHLNIDDRPAQLAPRREEGMLRLGYEAITYACKHAGATNLWLDVLVTGLAVVRVENDGTGPVSKRRNSYRWRTLSSIANQHDLYLAIEPRAPRGTTIEITAA
jgi:pilus assembly protein CpaE